MSKWCLNKYLRAHWFAPVMQSKLKAKEIIWKIIIGIIKIAWKLLILSLWAFFELNRIISQAMSEWLKKLIHYKPNP